MRWTQAFTDLAGAESIYLPRYGVGTGRGVGPLPLSAILSYGYEVMNGTLDIKVASGVSALRLRPRRL